MKGPLGAARVALFVAGLCRAQFPDPGPPPPPMPAALKSLVGEFGSGQNLVRIAERRGRLVLLDSQSKELPRVEYPEVARITPLRPVSELQREAGNAQPPKEAGGFRTPDLVELRDLDSSIHYYIRYATDKNFLGTPVYAEAHAKMQRPAAEALVRASHRLHTRGYGLLIHDAYRPWSVTKIFWEATPPAKRDFVADPSKGSRHNRGCAVDLTLYELSTGRPAEMTGAYDEMSERSYPAYPGGTSLQRWHRDLLRWAMESEGFEVYPFEWWHFDYKDWSKYPILNITLDRVP